MAEVTKVRRLANPRRKRRNPAKRKRLTPRQIRFFGSRQQKAALKRKRRQAAQKSHRRRSNPVTRVVKKVVHVYHNKKRKTRSAGSAKRNRRPRKRNSALILTLHPEVLGAVNPRRKNPSRKRRVTVAARKRKRVSRANPSRRRSRRVSAPRKINSHRRRSVPNGRRRNPRRRVVNRRRRNPALFGQSMTGGKMAATIAAGLGGVAVVKLIPTVLPASIPSSGLMGIAIAGASSFVLQFVARKLGLSQEMSSAVLFGGLMQTGSLLINYALPTSISTRLTLGELVPGSYPAPFNPVKAGAPVLLPTAAPGKGVSALSRTAFGRRY